MQPEAERGAAPVGTRGGRSNHHQLGDDDTLDSTDGYDTGKARPGLTVAEFNRKVFGAGPPPPKPYISPASRAIARAELEAERLEEWLAETSVLRSAAIGALVSLDRGQRPEAVARRLAAVVEAVAA